MKVATTVQIGDMTVKVKDLAEIDLYWLAEQVPQQMLIDIEDEQLRKEGKINVKQKYIPDNKTMIYNEFEKIDKFNRDDEYVFYNESGTKLYYRFKWDNIRLMKYLENENGDCIKASSDRFLLIDDNTKIIKYAELIDKIIGGNLKQQLLNELGVCIEKQILRNDMTKDKWTDLDEREKIIRKLPILSNLSKSYKKVMQQIEETKMNFGGQEKAKRDKFYKEEQNQFKEDLKVKKDNENEIQLLKKYEGRNLKRQGNLKQEKINEENGDGTEYRGG